MDGSWDGAADPPLASMLSLLVPEGVASLECSAADEARLRSALLFAGFVQIASGACAPGAGGAVRVRVTASKPAWEVGAAARLPGGAARLGTARLGAAPAVTATPAASTRVMLDDDLVDEDALMDDLPVQHGFIMLARGHGQAHVSCFIILRMFRVKPLLLTLQMFGRANVWPCVLCARRRTTASCSRRSNRTGMRSDTPRRT